MRWVQSAEGREKLPSFQLQIERQTSCLHECLLNFNLGFIVVIQFENDVREPFEVKIDRPVKRQLNVTRVKTALLWIMIADFDVIQIAGTGISECTQFIERHDHVNSAATDSDRLR